MINSTQRGYRCFFIVLFFFIKFEPDTETFLCNLFLLWSMVMNVITKQNAKSDQLFTLNSLESFKAWKIEEYHRGIKQFCGVERCQAGLQSSPRRNCEALKEHPGARLDILKGFKFRSVRTFRWFTDKQNILRNLRSQSVTL